MTGLQSGIAHIEEILSGFTPVSLEGLDAVSLQERTDTKYVFPIELLPRILSHIRDHYVVLEINQKRLFSYESIYYDTADLQTYLLHHNMRPGRFKIRLRRYVESGTAYIEIKTKNTKGKTVKNRMGVEESTFNLNSGTPGDFVKSKIPINPELLSPALLVTYNRFTLADHGLQERVTIDLNLAFKNLRNEAENEFSAMVVAEVKQPRFSRGSPLVQALQEEKIVPLSISKYCLGVLTCFPDVKYNRFKKKLIRVKKITGNISTAKSANGHF